MTFNVFTIIGLIYGAICGIIIGRNMVYKKLVKHNLLGEDANYTEYTIDRGSRKMAIAVGILFEICGVIILIAGLATAGKNPKNSMMAYCGAASFIAFSTFIIVSMLRTPVSGD